MAPLFFVRSPTPRLRTVVEQQQAALAPADFADMMSQIRSIFEKYTSALETLEPGIQRALGLHQMMEREMKAVSSVAVTCAKGCHGCCHYEVEVTTDEAQVLRQLVLEGFSIDRGRLEVQAARERKSPEWLKFWSEANRCVFLDATGSCGIYEHRPSICRIHLVTTPAEACTTAGAQVAPVQNLLAEILLSAALSLEGVSSGSLSKMLQQALAAG